MKTNSKSALSPTFELKYCERCGTIWLRTSGSARAQCAPCARAESSLQLGSPVSFLQAWTRLRVEAHA